MSPQPGFSCRNVWKPLTINFIGGQTKEIYLDVTDRGEVPQISDGYCISLAYVILLDVVRSLAIVFDKNEESKKECHHPLLGIVLIAQRARRKFREIDLFNFTSFFGLLLCFT